jgi:hypothetical protein
MVVVDTPNVLATCEGLMYRDGSTNHSFNNMHYMAHLLQLCPAKSGYSSLVSQPSLVDITARASAQRPQESGCGKHTAPQGAQGVLTGNHDRLDDFYGDLSGVTNPAQHIAHRLAGK